MIDSLFRPVACGVIVMAFLLLSGCNSSSNDQADIPIALGPVAFSPTTSQHIHFATISTPLTILRGRRFDSDNDGDIDAADLDTSSQTREFSYSAVTILGIPAVLVSVRETDGGVTTDTWSFTLARSTNGPVYVIQYEQNGGPFDFTAGIAGAEPVLFLPYDSSGILVAGTSYNGGFNHRFGPLPIWIIEGVDVPSPLGLPNTTDLHVDVGEATDRHFWFSSGDGIVEMDNGFSLAPTPPG